MNTSATHWEQERQCVKARSTHTHPHNHTYTLEISKASNVDGEQKPYGQKTIIRKKKSYSKKTSGITNASVKAERFFLFDKKKMGKRDPRFMELGGKCVSQNILGLFCLFTRSLLPVY
jgi:hypothetical protein